MVRVLIPTYNAGPAFDILLSRLKTQSVSCEITIIDSASTDETASIAQFYNTSLTRIKKEDFNHGRARNMAVDLSESEIIVFMTQDALPSNDSCLEELIRPLNEIEVVASFGRQIPRLDSSPVEEFARTINYPEAAHVKGFHSLPELGIKTFFFSNVCSAIKTKQFKELGCFPEDIIMFEDLIFAAKAILKGYKIAYVPEATVIHSHNFSLLQQFRRYFNAGLSLQNYPWILEYAKANKEGLTFLKKEIVFLAKRRQYQWIFYAIAESACKFAGFWLGVHDVTSRRKIGSISSLKHV